MREKSCFAFIWYGILLTQFLTQFCEFQNLESLSNFHQSIQFSHSILSNSLQLHGLHHARLLCLSPTRRACSNSCPVMPSNQLILYHPLLLSPSIFPSIRVFSNESLLRITWSKYWSFSSNEYLGWISFRINRLDLLAVQRTLKSPLKSPLKSTTVQKHLFFSTQPFLWFNSHIHTWLLKKTIALTIWTFVGKVMSQLFNKLSRFATTLLPKHFIPSETFFIQLLAVHGPLQLFA